MPESEPLPAGVLALLNRVGRLDRDTGEPFYTGDDGKPIRDVFAPDAPVIRDGRTFIAFLRRTRPDLWPPPPPPAPPVDPHAAKRAHIERVISDISMTPARAAALRDHHEADLVVNASGVSQYANNAPTSDDWIRYVWLDRRDLLRKC